MSDIKTRIERNTGGLYGRWFFHVLVTKSVSTQKHITFYADRVEVNDSGALVAYGGFREFHGDEPANPIVVISFAPGSWTSFYAASCLDGTPVACDYWHGEINRNEV